MFPKIHPIWANIAHRIDMNIILPFYSIFHEIFLKRTVTERDESSSATFPLKCTLNDLFTTYILLSRLSAFYFNTNSIVFLRFFINTKP